MSFLKTHNFSENSPSPNIPNNPPPPPTNSQNTSNIGTKKFGVFYYIYYFFLAYSVVSAVYFFNLYSNDRFTIASIIGIILILLIAFYESKKHQLKGKLLIIVLSIFFISIGVFLKEVPWHFFFSLLWIKLFFFLPIVIYDYTWILLLFIFYSWMILPAEIFFRCITLLFFWKMAKRERKILANQTAENLPNNTSLLWLLLSFYAITLMCYISKIYFFDQSITYGFYNLTEKNSSFMMVLGIFWGVMLFVLLYAIFCHYKKFFSAEFFAKVKNFFRPENTFKEKCSLVWTIIFHLFVIVFFCSGILSTINSIINIR